MFMRCWLLPGSKRRSKAPRSRSADGMLAAEHPSDASSRLRLVAIVGEAANFSVFPRRIMSTATTSEFSRKRLDQMHDLMAGHIGRGDLPGLVTLVSRRGETHVDAIGRLAFDGPPMARDSIFRITSMTKPVTATATMILVEDGKLQLDDPVDRFLPELANRRALRRIDAPVFDTLPAKRPITLRDLLTFRSGHGMIPVFPDRFPIQRAIAEAGFAPGPVFPSFPPDELMRRYGSLPLIF